MLRFGLIAIVSLIYRLPPLPPTSPDFDNLMTWCLQDWVMKIIQHHRDSIAEELEEMHYCRRSVIPFSSCSYHLAQVCNNVTNVMIVIMEVQSSRILTEDFAGWPGC